MELGECRRSEAVEFDGFPLLPNNFEERFGSPLLLCQTLQLPPSICGCSSVRPITGGNLDLLL